jgi:hypothetical protein
MHARAKTSNVVEYGRILPWLEPEWDDESELIYYSEFPFLPFRASQPIFRYMEYWKFKDLVESGHLHFPRADQFEIPLEGNLPNSKILGFAEREIAHSMGSKRYRASHEDADQQRRKSNALNFVSCWHMTEDGMARLRDRRAFSPESIFVVTTAGQLLRSMQAYVIASPVRYGVSKKPQEKFTPLNYFFHNDSGLASEREFRLVTNPFLLEPFAELRKQGDSSIRLPLDPADVISEVTLNRDATEDLREKVEGLMEEYLPGARLN